MKKIIIIIVVIFIVILLMPFKLYMKDSGSVEYVSLSYKITKVKSLLETSSDSEMLTFKEGTIIYIFGIEVYNKSNIVSYPNNTNTNYDYEGEESMKIYLKINEKILSATLDKNTSSEAFIEKIKNQDLTVRLHDYGNFEKVGNLGFELPTNDETITTKPGDIILYQGNSITIYYDTNTWSFTKLGTIDDIDQNELISLLGSKDVVVTFTLNK